MSCLIDVIPLLLASHTLELRDVIRLSQVSKDLQSIIVYQQSYYWKRLYEQITESGCTYNKHRGRNIEERSEVIMICNNFRHDDDNIANSVIRRRSIKPAFEKVDVDYNRLRPCFSSDAIVRNNIENNTYGHYDDNNYYLTMVKCLLSKTCVVCGNMSSYANPLTFTRCCRGKCAKIPTLCKNSELPNLSMKDSTFPSVEDTNNKDQYFKYTDDYLKCYPIGVHIKSNKSITSCIGFTNAVKCNHQHCNVSGCLDDVMRHERLQHHTLYSHAQYYDFETIFPEVQSQKQISNSFESKFLNQSSKLVDLLKGSTIKKAMGISSKKLNQDVVIAYYWTIHLKSGCRIGIDLRSIIKPSESKTDNYDIDILFQHQDNAVPFQVLFCSSYATRIRKKNREDVVDHNALTVLKEKLSVDTDNEIIQFLAILVESAVHSYILKDLSKMQWDNYDDKCQNLIRRIFRCGDQSNFLSPDSNACKGGSKLNLFLQKSNDLPNLLQGFKKAVNEYRITRLIRRRGEIVG